MDLSFYKKELEQIHAESFGWALRCCNYQREQAKDVLQSAYLKIFEGKARFNHKSSFKTWWFSVIRHTAIDWKTKLTKVSSREQAMEAGSPSVDMNTSLDEIIKNEHQLVFKKALGQLSQRQQEVLQLVFYHDMTIEKAATAMGVSIGSARTHYKRGKQNLGKILQNSDLKI
ncbi:MAG: sigma-70 family RNA polymerase sigma factor [Bacteroidota bacterium]